MTEGHRRDREGLEAIGPSFQCLRDDELQKRRQAR
jgi:hypothetical protein